MRGRRIGTMARVAGLAAAAALALGIGACGDDDSTTTDATGASAKTEAGAEAALADIISSKDPATCDRLTDNYIKSLFPTESIEDGRATCEEVITEGDDPGEINVRTITLEGDEASGDATSALGYQRFTLVYVDGEWQLDFLEAGPGTSKQGSGGSGSGGGNG